MLSNGTKKMWWESDVMKLEKPVAGSYVTKSPEINRTLIYHNAIA